MSRRFAVLCAAVLAAAGTGPSAGNGVFRGPIAAQVERVVDGDTIDVRAFIWIGQSLSIRVRIDGVDTPELRGHCPEERRRAEAARAYLMSRVAGAEVRLTAIAYDKYGGRIRAAVSDASGDVATALIARGFARPYHGERRRSWCTPS
jgi:endonuclease YncB( thermonuclease family)